MAAKTLAFVRTPLADAMPSRRVGGSWPAKNANTGTQQRGRENDERGDSCLSARTLLLPSPFLLSARTKKAKAPFNRIRLVGLRTTCPSRERTAARRAGRAGDPESVKERGRAASGPGRRQPCPPLPPRCVCGCGASFPPPRCLSPTQDERLEGEHGRCVRASLPVL